MKTEHLHDQTLSVVRRNLARINLISVAGPLLCIPRRCQRVTRLLGNRRQWGLKPPLLMLAVHNDAERAAADNFATSVQDLARCAIVQQKRHNETMGNALALFRQEFGEENTFAMKRQILLLTRRGGSGKPEFISPFTSGDGTTCLAWTHTMVRNRDGTPARNADGKVLKGFMKASLAVGFCPVECPFCYLQMPFTEGMDLALNWEDFAHELVNRWYGFPYPINFGETSGLVEYDEWLAGEGGEGSVVQFVINSCAAAGVTPFFLTKIRYPRYLKFDGQMQVGISLMPEEIRRVQAPHGSPSEELLDSLAWAVNAGARDPVIRMFVLWQARHLYPELLAQCGERLGKSGWRLTLDIFRVTPKTAVTIAGRHPEAAEVFAEELAPGSGTGLAELARDALSGEKHVKKIRPPEERQAEIYRFFRADLDRLGCRNVDLTACKGNPDELLPLVREKVIRAMPCACYGAGAAETARVGSIGLIAAER